jgi:hypothetical protein
MGTPAVTKIYLDDNGNEIKPKKVYLDDQGNPIPETPKPQAATNIGAAPATLSPAWLKGKIYDAIDLGADLLPGAGATAGAILGGGAGAPSGPGAIGTAALGAGIGGAGGEAAKKLIKSAVFPASPMGPQAPLQVAQEIGLEGAMQGVIEAGTRGLGRLAGPLKRQALGQYERALAPTKEINKSIVAKRAPEMIDRGITGSLEDMNAKAAGKASGLRAPLDAAYAKIPGGATHAQSPISVTLNELDTLKAKYVVGGQVANPQAVKAIEGVQEVLQQYDNAISPKELRQLKQVFQENVAASGGYGGKDLATEYSRKAQKVAAARINDILHKASPEAANIDKEISFWLDVKRVTQQSGLRKTGQEGGMLRPIGNYAINLSGLGGTALGGPAVGLTAASVTYAATLATQIIKSPQWRTFSAVNKSRIADLIANGDAQRAAALAARLGIAGLEHYAHEPVPSPATQ